MAQKTERIDLRVTPEEKTIIQTAAATAGLTITAYLLAQIGLAVGDAIGKAIVEGRDKK